MATKSSHSFAEQLQALKRKFETADVGPETRQSVLDELDSTIESLKRIRAEMAADEEEGAEACKGTLCLDTRLNDYLKKYNTTLDEFMKSSDTYPNGFIDAGKFKATIEEFERRICVTETHQTQLRKSLADKKRAADEQLSRLQNGQQVNHREIEAYNQAVSKYESQLLCLETQLVGDYKTLWNFIQNVRPIDGRQFTEEFTSVMKAKVALAKVKAAQA